MTKLLVKTFERTLNGLVAEYSGAAPGTHIDAWVFENADARRDAENRLADKGVEARFRSAYKPLVHFFLEDADRSGLARVDVSYPVHAGCAPERFLLEAYPLSELVGGAKVVYSEGDTDGFFYGAKLEYADGRVERVRIFAPNRQYVDHAGETVVTPSGWLAVSAPDGSISEGWLKTDYEAIYAEALAAVSNHPWGKNEPFFDALSLRVTLPASDIPLSVGQEVLSLREAMHEDLYFSMLELFQKKTGKPLSDRTIRPGQVIRLVVGGKTPALCVELSPLSSVERDGGFQNLETAEGPLSAAQVASELGKIEGQSFSALSYSGRSIPALYHAGSGSALMISGGQHANETTGVVGALRAAKRLAQKPGAHFSVSPLENPDGYALHGILCADNPAHMHHAARYTALGNDLEYQEEGSLYEKKIRVEAQRLTDAKLHINLHGYASHEWTRPLSGYIPRGFPTWMLPHGFFLVLRHHASWADFAREFLERLTLKLADVPGLLEFTQAQLSVYSIYVNKPSFQILNGFPCELAVNETSTIPLRLITEYPDETIWGKDFAAGHAAQMEAVLASYGIFQEMMAR